MTTRLFEAIVDANHRAAAGGAAGLHPAEFANDLPIIALTCIDPRLNPLLPGALGIPEEQFIWLRNAGNIITGPLSSTMRSLALACALKGGKEIAVIGHSDCIVARTPIMTLIDRFKDMGVVRHKLPQNITDFFGTFASESQNVIKAVDYIRESPLVGPSIPVHGLLIDTKTGRLEWLSNGYKAFDRSLPGGPLQSISDPAVGNLPPIGQQALEGAGNIAKQIGDFASKVEEWLEVAEEHLAPSETAPPPPPPSATPPPLPTPPTKRILPFPPKIINSPRLKQRFQIKRKQ